MADKLTFSVVEMAKVLGISRSTAYSLIHAPNFPIINVGRRRLIPKAALERWLEKGGMANENDT